MRPTLAFGVRWPTVNALYERYKRALGDARLPAAIVDLDAVDRNVGRLLTPVRANGKTLRIATKSLRCPELVSHVAARGGDAVRGLMTYDATETAYLAERGERDLLLAYPTASRADARLLAELNASGARAAVVVDDEAHVSLLAEAARATATSVPLLVEVDLSYRPLGTSLHLGVRRSPLRTVEDVTQIARLIERTDGVSFLGVMGYEAHIAGVGDADRRTPLASAARRAMKLRARAHVERTRRALSDALHPTLFNGGGSGSVAWSSAEPWLTEVTAGSGFVDSHLFDHFRDVPLEPAIFFALQVVRVPGPGFVTCHGGGFVASGAAGVDRLPIPALPEGLGLVPLEGAGEVQTPLVVPKGKTITIGDPVFFRHAKAGELAEHFDEYLFVRGDRVVSRGKTYRGLGKCFLG
jgi:D-serine deaminase-like pyridoxal phosphate-dependent protein